MARKTFISYKYNESCKYRDKVIESLGDDATYYTGETADSPDISNLKVDSIKNHLKDMIFNTTVTMVILSPSLVKSKWVEWEIEYSLSKYSRDGKTSSINGLIGIIPPFDGDYSWFISAHSNPDGHETNSYINEKARTFRIMYGNRYTQNPKEYACPCCESVDQFTRSYLSYVKLSDFCTNPDKYIESAYEKSQHLDSYNLRRKI